MRVDDATFGNLNADQTRKIISDLCRELGLQPGAPIVAGASGAQRA
jgi:hypothetical protein